MLFRAGFVVDLVLLCITVSLSHFHCLLLVGYILLVLLLQGCQANIQFEIRSWNGEANSSFSKNLSRLLLDTNLWFTLLWFFSLLNSGLSTVLSLQCVSFSSWVLVFQQFFLLWLSNSPHTVFTLLASQRLWQVGVGWPLACFAVWLGVHYLYEVVYGSMVPGYNILANVSMLTVIQVTCTWDYWRVMVPTPAGMC